MFVHLLLYVSAGSVSAQGDGVSMEPSSTMQYPQGPGATDALEVAWYQSLLAAKDAENNSKLRSIWLQQQRRLGKCILCNELIRKLS